jgi:hypothetical protein
MIAGSITGTLLGALLLGVIPNLVLIPSWPCSSWPPPSSSGGTDSHVERGLSK